jgi:L,D-peptidoglycan transpeptidase YkuD (ErfK/YbiS/YcfS/YnhG family)
LLQQSAQLLKRQEGQTWITSRILKLLWDVAEKHKQRAVNWRGKFLFACHILGSVEISAKFKSGLGRGDCAIFGVAFSNSQRCLTAANADDI